VLNAYFAYLFVDISIADNVTQTTQHRNTACK